MIRLDHIRSDQNPQKDQIRPVQFRICEQIRPGSRNRSVRNLLIDQIRIPEKIS